MHECLICQVDDSLNALCGLCGDCFCPDHIMYVRSRYECYDCSKKNEQFKIPEIEKALDISAKQWEGRCYEIAGLLITKYFSKFSHTNIDKSHLKLCYGIWEGDVHPASMFAGKGDSVRHGWINHYGTIIDPTRWVFEHVSPYIYFGPNNGEYDYGAERFRQKFRQPCPSYNPQERQIDISKMPAKARKYVQRAISGKTNKVSVSQLAWVGATGMSELGEVAKPLYEWLIKENMGGLIPIDFRQAVLEV